MKSQPELLAIRTINARLCWALLREAARWLMPEKARLAHDGMLPDGDKPGVM